MISDISAAKTDKNALSELLEKNKPLIYSIVKRYINLGTDADDLFQLGSIGFIKAVRDFDESYGTSFSTYAVPKIAGEIKRYLRDDGMIKISRSIKEKNAKINAANAAFEKMHGRCAKLSELCEMTGITPDDITLCLSTSGETCSLDAEISEGFSLMCLLESGESEERLVQRIDLSNAVKALPESERKIIELRFFHGLTQQKTAGLLEMSQVQVSRTERRAVKRLKAMLT